MSVGSLVGVSCGPNVGAANGVRSTNVGIIKVWPIWIDSGLEISLTTMISSTVVLKSSAIALSVSPDLTMYIPLGVGDGMMPSAYAVTVALISSVAAGVMYNSAADVLRGASSSLGV